MHWGRLAMLGRSLQCTNVVMKLVCHLVAQLNNCHPVQWGSWGWVPVSKAFTESLRQESLGAASASWAASRVGRSVSHLCIGPWIFRWLGVKGHHCVPLRVAKKMLSCIWAPARQLSALPFSSCPVRSSQPSVNNWNKSYFIEAFTKCKKSLQPQHPSIFLRLCSVLRCHPTRAVRSGEFALSVSNWIPNQTLERLRSSQTVLWHFKRADKSIFTSGMQTADLTQWKLVCESSFEYNISSWSVDFKLMNIYLVSQQTCGRDLPASSQINGLISVMDVTSLSVVFMFESASATYIQGH